MDHNSMLFVLPLNMLRVAAKWPINRLFRLFVINIVIGIKIFIPKKILQIKKAIQQMHMHLKNNRSKFNKLLQAGA